MTWKMSLEKRLVDRDRFDADTFRSAFVEADDAVDHQKGITMRQNPHDLFAVESAVTLRHDSWNGERFAPRLFFGDNPGQFRIRRVAGFYRDEMAANSTTDQREIADDVENFVSDEFIGKTQWLFAQDGVAAHDHGV